jgi:hypothetical protein
MIVYTYDNSGYYLGQTQAKKNPRNPQKYLIPMNSTEIAPPNPSEYTADKIPVFNKVSNEWELVDSPLYLSTQEALLEEVNSVGVKLYELDVNGKVILRDQEEVDSETELKNKIHQARDKKLEIEIDIANKAIEMTNSSNVESAKAETDGWQLRRELPNEYEDLGLIVTYEQPNYPIGTPLDNAIAVNEYYSLMALELDKFRLAKINEYGSISSKSRFRRI